MNIRESILFIIVASFIFLLIKVKEKTPRVKYENFLLSQYKIIPNHSREELKEIPKPEYPHMATVQNFFMSIDPELGYVPSDRLHEAFISTRNIRINSS